MAEFSKLVLNNDQERAERYVRQRSQRRSDTLRRLWLFTQKQKLGECLFCPAEALDGYVKCEDHLEQYAEADYERYHNRSERKVCTKCGNSTFENTSMCEKHLIANRERVRKHREKTRGQRKL